VATGSKCDGSSWHGASGSPGLRPFLPNIARGRGLGHSAPLGGGLTNNARLAFLRPSNRWTSAFAVRGCSRGRAVLARAI
jgi:hypothetical protein